MKNKLLLTVLPLLALTSCGQNPQAFTPYVDYVAGIPTVHNAPGDNPKVYLMLSRRGYIEVGGVKTKGENVPEKYYENCIVWEDTEGNDLPVAKSEVADVTFRGWAFYNEDNDNVWPDYYTKLTADINGKALKAIFDGTNAGGGGGGGGGGSEATNITWTVEDMPTWVKDDGCIIFAWAWQNGVDGKWYELTYTSETSATFEAPSDLAGMLLARCAAGTTTPDWTKTTDGAGRVHNKTNDVNTEPGKTSYSFPTAMWSEYNPGA